MNKMQKEISELIFATLDIILRNDSGEILKWVARNLIAKYSLANDHYYTTQKTLFYLTSKGVDIKKRYNKNKKNEYTFEHPIPAKIVLEELLKVRKNEDRLKILKFSDCVVILSNEENKNLKRQNMPSNWQYFDNLYARYDEVGIKVLNEKIEMVGAVRR